MISYKKQRYIEALLGLLSCFHRFRNFLKIHCYKSHLHTTAILMQFVLFHGLFYILVVWLDCGQIRQQQYHLSTVVWMVLRVVHANTNLRNYFKSSNKNEVETKHSVKNLSSCSPTCISWSFHTWKNIIFTSKSRLKQESMKYWRQIFGFLWLFSLLIFRIYLFLWFTSFGSL